MVVDQDHLRALLAGRQSNGHSGGAAADDRHVGVEVLMVVVGVGDVVDVYFAQPGNAADDFLGEPPEPLGTVQGLVVEAHRHQPVEVVKNREKVTLERRPSVLMGDLHSRPNLLDASADVGNVVHGDQAIGAPARYAKKSARAMVLEAPAEHVDAGGAQGRRHRVPLVGVDRPAVELKAYRRGPVYSFSRPRA